MTDRAIIRQFTILTFAIAYVMSGITIALGQFGLTVQSTVTATFQSLPHLLPNIPYALYILSPAIASYIVLKYNNKVTTFKEWLGTVFYARNKISCYLYITAVLLLYFGIHLALSDGTVMVSALYIFIFSLPGNLVIGGLEEAGWSYILQPWLDKKYGYIISSLLFGLLWLFWHIPLFFIPGTSHCDGVIDFWMFAVQVIAFRFIFGAVYKLSGKGGVFMCVLFHTMFNAASFAVGIPPTTWAGTITANVVMVLVALITVYKIRRKKPNAESI